MASLKDLKVELTEVNRSINEITGKIRTLIEKQEKYENRKKQLEHEITQRENNYFQNENSEAEMNWSSEGFTWNAKLNSMLREKFGIRKLREMQLETINATMSKRDVILIMPTGGGKSLCYQAPALLTAGLTLVISPLISLIEDQIFSLQNLGIQATKLNASSTREEVNKTHKEMVNKSTALKLLYVTPEKISKSKRFMSQLEKCYKVGNLSRIAIDEVHCASQWGNDFRPDYKILGLLKRQFPDTPLLGLTATSTDKVTLDTKKILNIPFSLVFKTPLNRANLLYEVRRKPESHEEVVKDMVKTINSDFQKSSGIVYCFSCKNCEEVCSSLSSHGVLAAVYHARLTSEERSRVHRSWLEDKVQVICATVAFGMGIDKADVRFVMHYSLSKSVENYYQESGRAGRDGLPALCRLYYGFSDIFRQSTMVLTEQTGLENLNKMLEYCQNREICRRVSVFSHFGEDWDASLCNGSCDVCRLNQDFKTEDVTEICQELITVTRAGSAANERQTGTKLKEAAKGRGKFKSRNSRLNKLSDVHCERIIVFMLLNQYLKEEFHFTPYSTISYLVPGPKASMLSIERVKLSLPENSPEQPSLFKSFYTQQTSQEHGPTTTKRTLKSDCSENLPNLNKKLKSETIVIDVAGSSGSNDKKKSAKIKKNKKIIDGKDCLSARPIIISDSEDEFVT